MSETMSEWTWRQRLAWATGLDYVHAGNWGMPEADIGGDILDALDAFAALEAENARLRAALELAERRAAKAEGANDRLVRAAMDATLNDPRAPRASGQTTRMLLRGLIAISEGRDVWVVGMTQQHGHSLAQQLLRMARDMSIPVTVVRGGGPGAPRSGFHGVTLFDRTAIEKDALAANPAERAEEPSR